MATCFGLQYYAKDVSAHSELPLVTFYCASFTQNPSIRDRKCCYLFDRNSLQSVLKLVLRSCLRLPHLIGRLSQKSLFTSAKGQLHCAGSGEISWDKKKKHTSGYIRDLSGMFVGVTYNTFYNGSYCPFTATSCADLIT